MSRRVAVIGFGAWGTALASRLAAAGHAVCAWTPEDEVVAEANAERRNRKYLPGVALPRALRVERDAAAALEGAEAVVVAVPTQSLRAALEAFSASVPPQALLISAAKGLEVATRRRPTQVLAEVLPGRPRAALLGPSHAEEVARGVPTSVAASAEDDSVARAAQALFHDDTLRVYRNDDLAGAECASALKNVIAIAAGISDGLGFGDNTKGALLTRGLAEMARLGVALGGRRETFFGLTGLGDLVTTSFSPFSRNRHVGERVGRGEPLDRVLASMSQVAEGVPTATAALALARENGVEVPIIEQVEAVLHQDKSPRDALQDLLSRDPGPE